MPKYWGKQIFSLGRFPEVGQKQKTEKRERKRERPKVGNNNGQLCANATSVGARKPPGQNVKFVFYSNKISIFLILRTKADNKCHRCSPDDE